MVHGSLMAIITPFCNVQNPDDVIHSVCWNKVKRPLKFYYAIKIYSYQLISSFSGNLSYLVGPEVLHDFMQVMLFLAGIICLEGEK